MTDLFKMHAESVVTDLLYELECANQIIKNALNIMTTEQKDKWAIENSSDCVDGDGITRANERRLAIKRATESGLVKRA